MKWEDKIKTDSTENNHTKYTTKVSESASNGISLRRLKYSYAYNSVLNESTIITYYDTK
jgi:hypothetical protein